MQPLCAFALYVSLSLFSSYTFWMGSVLSYNDCYSFFAISKSSVQLDYTHTLSRLIWSSQHIWHSIALAFSFDRLFMFDNGEKIFIASAVNLSCSSIYLLNLFHIQTNYFHFERTTFRCIAIGSQFCSLNEFPFSRCFICVDVVVIFIYSKSKLFEKQRVRDTFPLLLPWWMPI